MRLAQFAAAALLIALLGWIGHAPGDAGGPPGHKALTRAAIRTPEGTWAAGEIVLPQPGIGTTRVTVVPETGSPLVLDAPVVVER
jgi:hypothetical protein